MQKVLNKCQLKEEPDDSDFWFEKSPLERIEGLEQIRRQHIFMFYHGINPGFQRVYRAFKRL